MESIKPDTRARTSTVATGTNRPVYSSHSVIDFCSGFDTVTGGGGGAALATGLLSQPASGPANNAATIKWRTPIIGPISCLRLQPARGETSLFKSFLWPSRQPP